MAAIIASRRSAKLLEKLLSSGRGVPSPASPAAACASRSFNTSAEARDVELGEERSVDVQRRGGRAVSRRRDGDPFSVFFPDVLDPIFPGRSLSQVLNLMDQLVENPMAMASRGMGMLGGPRRGWNVKEDEDALYLRVDMPGLGKEHVKVAVEQNTLVIRGEGEKESAEDEAVPRYSSRIDLPPELYKLDQIRAEMKNGMLKVLVPKAKEEERKDVVEIKVD